MKYQSLRRKLIRIAVIILVLQTIVFIANSVINSLNPQPTVESLTCKSILLLGTVFNLAAAIFILVVVRMIDRYHRDQEIVEASRKKEE